MKGIVLAGGTGSRLWPITKVTSKQLLQVYDKPMIYYPISTLMLAGIREILIITTPHDQQSFQELLGDGSELGIKFNFAVQSKPNGIAEAFLIAEKFLDNNPSMLILGDNIFHGVGLGNELQNINETFGAHIFTYEVSNPSHYGIVTLDNAGLPISVIEKPSASQSNLAITGLYIFDKNVTEVAKDIRPSARGELEITAVIEKYLSNGSLSITKLSRGTAWLDTGNPNSMHDAATYIRVIEERTGLKIGCLEEIAFRKGFISANKLKELADKLGGSEYSNYLKRITI
jgi:glucose-1-phosphate thymidylyltransferase